MSPLEIRRPDPGRRADVAEWLTTALMYGPKPVGPLRDAARIDGLTDREVVQAVQDMGAIEQDGWLRLPLDVLELLGTSE